MYATRFRQWRCLFLGAAYTLFGLLPTLLSAQTDSASVQDAVQSMGLVTAGTVEIAYSPNTGLVNFVSTTAAHPLPVASAATAPAPDRALAFINTYGKAFGLTGAAQVQVTDVQEADEVGLEQVRLQQIHQGVPVTGAEMTIQMSGTNVVAVLAKTLGNLNKIETTPSVTAASARQAVRDSLAKQHQGKEVTLSPPRLEILNRGLLEGQPSLSRLAWFVEAGGDEVRQYSWIDARTGAVLLSFSQLTDARVRRVYDANSTSTLPGTLRRSEGDAATGDADVDRAYDFSGHTYHYFLTKHGRDSFDNAGAAIISTVRFCPPGNCPYLNAFWNGTQMVYGANMTADDVVGHEITHAVTERTARLFYYMQSGALNESFSDIFGETIDLTNAAGTDTAAVRWKLGEDLPAAIGVIRDMRNPNSKGDPGKVSDPQFVCSDFSSDQGGVHTNSGVPNKAYTLMADGGTYNGVTVSSIGLTKAGKIQYRALSKYLISGSDFLDNYHALQRSCTDLVGMAGITAADCTQVKKALDAVEMSRPACGQPAAPRLCPAGTTLVSLYNDPLNTLTSTRWNNPVLAGANHWSRDNWFWADCRGTAGIYCRGYATSGLRSFGGANIAVVGDSAVAMTTNVAIPALGGGISYLYFNHAFDFEAHPSCTPNSGCDGGVVERSTNGGATWSDAGALINGGKPYGGTISTGFGNPLGGRAGFIGTSFGYTSTRVNLSTLADSNVRFRFRMGTDRSVAFQGWAVDDIRIYQCQ